MKPILETERLVFTPFTAEDLDLLASLHSDPEVQRYIGGMWDRETIQKRLDQYVSDQATRGVSKWKAHLRDGTFVGRAGISWWEPESAYELGYSFARAAWGLGLASEAAQGIVDWFFATTPHRTLIGFADVGNLASRRVLEKVGMTWLGDKDMGFGGLSSLYRMDRPT
ncbi:GNAT family N-acetyltransferase [Phenylobacterium sp.]|jgi:ribosomal-protein-alanine N-acetyltransferase|uniref:GNAT family N-acetyltransferase n=1 Tax=Phenylobacterium sp. TaxID=1871053 RepID=UPI002F95A07B